MPAYFAEVPCEGPARNCQAFERIKPGSRWKAAAGSVNGKNGTIIWLDGDQPSEGEWITCPDGLLYLNGQSLPPIATLARQHNVQGVDYTTSKGCMLTIPVASAAPRRVLFGAKKTGSVDDKFALDAFALFDRLEKKDFVALDDPSIVQLVADAINHVYYMTPEMLDEYGIITTADIDPILMCLMGVDPKKVDASGNAG